MKFDRALVSMLALFAWSSAALSAPLQQDEEAGFPAGASARPEVSSSGQIHAGPAVRGSGTGHPLIDADGDGLSDGLEAQLAASPADARVDVIVSFSGPGSAASAQGQVGPFEVRHEYRLLPAFSATMSATQVRALAQVAGADYGLDGTGLTVCVIDTGLAADHEQFVDETSGSSDAKVLGFKDFIGDSNGVIQINPYDDHGHGSHVASTILGDGSGSAPLAARLRGVAPAAQVYAAKVLDADGVGDSSGIIAAIDWCVVQGVDIINMSLGVPGGSDGQDALSLAANAAVEAGVVVVVAAGNAGDAPSTIGSPGAADLVVTVGAAAEWSGDPSDPDEAIWTSLGVYPAPFSSRGPALDGDIKPDILGPGVTIAAALGDYQGIYAAIFGCVNDCYIELSGTSMAAPYVAGAVALMLEANPTLTPAQVAQALYATAQDHSPEPGKDNATGHGLVDAFAAIEWVALGGVFSPTAFPTFTYGSDTVPNGGDVWIPIEVTDTSAPLAVTVTIDGQFKCFSRLGRTCLASGWSPDLETQLYDPDMNPYEEPNPLYPWLSPDPMIAVAGTQSTCPAGYDCGQAGAQETLYFRPPSPGTYWVRVYPFDGAPNNGTGGSFSYQISYGPAIEPANLLIANAGSDQNVTDGDKDGFEMVTLDGGASSGPITGYLWTDETGATVSTEASVSLSLAVGTYLFDLTVDDGSGNVASDTVSVSVATSKKGGGGGGNGGGGGPKSKGGQANGT
jgi:serine protease AprX